MSCPLAEACDAVTEHEAAALEALCDVYVAWPVEWFSAREVLARASVGDYMKCFAGDMEPMFQHQ